MCPSFQVTREEMHTTRGRTRLLFEMLQGDIVTDGWRSREVKEALDLCLSCKGCTNDCPVGVDVPTYKAEFLHHHWKGRLRPRPAYAMGLIDQAARVASHMPGRHLCCGRPLYDYGFLGLAERYLRRVLDGLREEIRAGTPVVGMEPSCLATFKDELPKMLPHDDDARRLRDQALHFSEFFQRFEVESPTLDRRALLWGHCHHKATGGMEPEQRLLERMGLEVDHVQGGCCGLAGSWGFEASHHEISIRAGEQALLPAVRKAPQGTLIVANGFSCRSQIEQAGTGR